MDGAVCSQVLVLVFLSQHYQPGEEFEHRLVVRFCCSSAVVWGMLRYALCCLLNIRAWSHRFVQSICKVLLTRFNS